MYRLRKENPEKEFFALRKDMICPSMKRTTLKSVLRSLQENTHIINVPEEIRIPARKALDRMLALR